MGSLTLDELLDRRPRRDETVGKMKVSRSLESLPGLGKVKARRLMETVGISESRRLQGLGAKQRADLLKRAHWPADAADLRPSAPVGPARARSRERLVGPRPDAVAEPLVDHPPAPPGRGDGRLRLRRPGRLRGRRSADGRLPRVGRVPRPPLRHPVPDAAPGRRRPARDRRPGRPSRCWPARPDAVVILLAAALRRGPGRSGCAARGDPRTTSRGASRPGPRGGPRGPGAWPADVVVNDDVERAGGARSAGILAAAAPPADGVTPSSTGRTRWPNAATP